VSRAAIRLACLVVGILCAPADIGAGEPPRIAIVRAPVFVSEGEWIRVFVQVTPHPDNLAFILAAVDEGGTVRQSLVQLEGDTAARSWWIDWREGLPAGELELVAVLITKTGQGPLARRSIHVLARR